jgi:hypothetical protein
MNVKMSLKIKEITIESILENADEKLFLLDLRDLRISVNALPSLQKFTNLGHLECSNSNITCFSSRLPLTLKVFICSFNHLIQLPDLSEHVNLTFVDASSNKLVQIVDNQLSDSIKYLNVSFNCLQRIDGKLPLSLKYFYCHSNMLECITKGLPSNLRDFVCHKNRFVELPECNSCLSILKCHDNQLMQLPKLDHTHLRVLYCNSNNLTFLPLLPECLNILSCGNNLLLENLQIKLPSQLETLRCNGCKNLIRLPEFPKHLTLLDISGCEKLQCIPSFHLDWLDENDFIVRGEVPSIYVDNSVKTINGVNQFRQLYFVGKFGKRIFFSLLTRRMLKMKKELLETSARIVLSPKRLSKLLENKNIFDENFETWFI